MRLSPDLRRGTPILAAWRITVPDLAAVVGSATTTAAQLAFTLVFALASIYLVRTPSMHEFGHATFGTNAHSLLLTVAGLCTWAPDVSPTLFPESRIRHKGPICPPAMLPMCGGNRTSATPR